MCRLFGFRSVIPSQVHRSLMAADNALAVQSQRHPDGWGVGYFIDGVPHLVKSSASALDDALFRRVSGVVSSETVIAHVRKATQGSLGVLNSHPFQHGRWVLAHNGDVPNFSAVRSRLDDEIAPRLRRFILGETDSERIFFLFLSELARHGDPAGPLSLEAVIPALRATVATVRSIADPPLSGEGKRSLLTLLVTNGTTMAAHQGGKELFFSTWKRRCGDRDVCPSLAACCEAPASVGGKINHLLIASEPLQGENVWEEMDEGDIVGVDWRMSLMVDKAAGERKAVPMPVKTACAGQSLQW
ncbi:putative glutamine amidotransferase type 2 [Hyaloraphidium curvatum]|nr:putative glutamine amidotransferase type 2 [Hyaloraphidium curvatum]